MILGGFATRKKIELAEKAVFLFHAIIFLPERLWDKRKNSFFAKII
jgi:hypothetical protein